MNTEMEEIRQMQAFIGETRKPSTIYRQDGRPECGYEVWLTRYKQYVRSMCEAKLLNDFNANLGKRLFSEKFSSFQEFSRQ